MIYRVNNRDIEFSSNVIRVMESYIQDDIGKPEAGGIVLGKVSEDGTIFITDISIPNIFDRASRYNFDRDLKAAQIIVNHEFANSAGKCIYLGEWHTHPEKKPRPSGQDKRMIRGQFEKGKLNERFILLVIQGVKEIFVSLFDGKTFRKANFYG